jgi:DNA-binding CsgD family transcriptional regulator
MDTHVETLTSVEQKKGLARALARLGVGLLEVVTSIRDEIAVVDRQRRLIAVLGEWPDELRPDDVIGKPLRDVFGGQAAAIHEAAHDRALHGEHAAYDWTRRKGRQATALSTIASPLLDSSSKIVGVVMLTRTHRPSTRDGKSIDAARAQRTKRLLEIEEGIQQLAGTIESYRKVSQLPRELDANSPLHVLSSRERQVLDLLGQGYRPRSIAEKLRLSPETVRNHLKAMFRKTGTHSQEELTEMLRASFDF